MTIRSVQLDASPPWWNVSASPCPDLDRPSKDSTDPWTPDTSLSASDALRLTGGVVAVDRHNWPLIRADFIEGVEVDGELVWPTYPELSAQHGVHLSLIKARAQ